MCYCYDIFYKISVFSSERIDNQNTKIPHRNTFHDTLILQIKELSNDTTPPGADKNAPSKSSHTLQIPCQLRERS